MITWSTTYQSLSLTLWHLGNKVKCFFFSLLSDDPNLHPSPLVPADSNKAKKKAMFSGFHFVHQHYSIAQWGRGGGSCLRLPLPSWCSIMHSRFGSSTVSTLVHGCEETTCYLLYADRHGERESTAEYLLAHFCWTPIIKKLFVRL